MRLGSSCPAANDPETTLGWRRARTRTRRLGLGDTGEALSPHPSDLTVCPRRRWPPSTAWLVAHVTAGDTTDGRERGRGRGVFVQDGRRLRRQGRLWRKKATAGRRRKRSNPMYQWLCSVGRAGDLLGWLVQAGQVQMWMQRRLDSGRREV